MAHRDNDDRAPGSSALAEWRRMRGRPLHVDYDDSRSSPWKRFRDRVEAANNEHKTEKETT